MTKVVSALPTPPACTGGHGTQFHPVDGFLHGQGTCFRVLSPLQSVLGEASSPRELVPQEQPLSSEKWELVGKHPNFLTLLEHSWGILHTGSLSRGRTPQMPTAVTCSVTQEWLPLFPFLNHFLTPLLALSGTAPQLVSGFPSGGTKSKTTENSLTLRLMPTYTETPPNSGVCDISQMYSGKTSHWTFGKQVSQRLVVLLYWGRRGDGEEMLEGEWDGGREGHRVWPQGRTTGSHREEDNKCPILSTETQNSVPFHHLMVIWIIQSQDESITVASDTTWIFSRTQRTEKGTSWPTDCHLKFMFHSPSSSRVNLQGKYYSLLRYCLLW